jgi:riboflavin kinase / FMN adenylyltransferase
LRANPGLTRRRFDPNEEVSPGDEGRSLETFRGYTSLPRRLRNPVVAIGNFDGVHRGHQAIFDLVRGRAEADGGESVVLTFEPHPVKVLAPAMAPALITTYARKLELVAACGVDVAVVQPFDQALAAMSADQFIKEVLVRALGARGVVVGYTFSFGRDRAGTPEMLRGAGAELGFTVTVVPPLTFDGLVTSSTKVREFVLEGRVDAAAKVLGREFELNGVIVRGAGRGRGIGVPTANLQPEEELVPRGGVYVGHVRRQGQRLPAVINVGINPTFVDGGVQTIEAHVLDFDADLYGERLTFEFHQRLRAEQRFSGVAELVARIQADIEQGREILRRQGEL